MSKATLVVMAAGIGSRFGGGIKQLEPVGPNGEIIMDYSIYDAMEAGFDKVVFVIRKDLEKDLNSKIDIVINNSKTLIGLDKDKLREQIAKLVKHYLKFNTQLKEVDELKEKNEKLENDNILLVEDNSKKDKVITKLKDDNSILNSELNTLKKSELFLKNQLNELKIATQKQLNSLNDVLGKIKAKIGKFKSFILFKGLDKDFKEYELNLQNEPDKNISLEVEHSSGHHSYFDR